MTRHDLRLRINDHDYDIAVEHDTLLLDALRYDCGLTGTKLGCGTGDCGACTVTLDGVAVNACLVYVVECEGHALETIEGVTIDGIGSVIAKEFVKADAVQCGFCTPGFIMSTYALLARSEPGAVADDDIKEALSGNLCRCTGYLPILQAVRRASEGSR